MPETGAGSGDFIRVGTLDELCAKGRMVVKGATCPLLVVHHQGRVFALDNRCPHLGFPLHRGSVEDGILTCHWHHARFDLESGGTFDPWADDVAKAAVELRGGEVWVARRTRYADEGAHWRNRLTAGLEHNLGLVIAKAILGLAGEGVAPSDIVREAIVFGVENRDGWGTGLTILTALSNLLPWLPEEETYLALYQGARRVAADCEGAAPRRRRAPFATGAHDLATLTRWLRHWTRVRHRDGAERTLLTAIAAGAGPADVATALLGAATDRIFADGGHALDFINKAFEALELVGWQHAALVLPAVVEQLVSARGAEELNAWRHPIDLVPLCEAAFARLPAGIAAGAGWRGHAALARDLLGDDPAAIFAALDRAIAAGAGPSDLARALAYAAALRVARFGTSNEFSDWLAAHHCFTYCNALHAMLARVAPPGSRPVKPELLRGVYHGAMRVYLIRFLNVPPARLPGEAGESLDDLPAAEGELAAAFLAALDRHGAVEGAARLISRTLALGHDPDKLVAVLARATLREDADFHTYQMLEAGVAQARQWGAGAEGRHILIAVARYLAAHSPTERAHAQTAAIARRLAGGQAVHESDDI
ncbi:MAG: Rieske (2Fe-2S) protein [Pseudomonadota bacterium]